MSPDTAKLVELARLKGITITTAESCTGGMVSAAITDVAGSSQIFEYGFVTYSNKAKQQMLGVHAGILEQFGAVSEQVAREMAQGAKRAAKADIAISITGIAGPGGSEFKPEGRVCFGLCTPAGTISETLEFGAIGRENVRNKSVDHAIAMVLNVLQGA